MTSVLPHVPDWVVAANDPEDPFVFVVASTLTNPPYLEDKSRYDKVTNLEGTKVLCFPYRENALWGAGFFDYSAVEIISKEKAYWDNFFLMDFRVRNTGMRLSQLRKVIETKSSFIDTLNTMLGLIFASADTTNRESVLDGVADIVASYALESF